MMENCHIFANSHCAMLLKAIGQSFSIKEYRKTAGNCKCYWIASGQFLKGIGYHWEIPRTPTGKMFLLAACDEKSFFYNVFRTTRYKTTSLPAALNEARRIDTLDVFYYMEHINWSCILWNPKFYIVVL